MSHRTAHHLAKKDRQPADLPWIIGRDNSHNAVEILKAIAQQGWEIGTDVEKAVRQKNYPFSFKVSSWSIICLRGSKFSRNRRTTCNIEKWASRRGLLKPSHDLGLFVALKYSPLALLELLRGRYTTVNNNLLSMPFLHDPIIMREGVISFPGQAGESIKPDYRGRWGILELSVERSNGVINLGNGWPDCKWPYSGTLFPHFTPVQLVP